MSDFLKIAKSIAVHFAHICAYGVETVKGLATLRVMVVRFLDLGKLKAYSKPL